MKVLFLDIDGVINSMAWLKEEKPDQPRIVGFRQKWQQIAENAFDPKCVARIDSIVARTDCVICISSSWRKEYPLTQLDRMLRYRGLNGQRIVGCTPSLKHTTPGSQRGDEIQHWLSLHGLGPELAVVLDDDNDMGPVLHRHVQTDCEVGITDDDVERAVALFQGESA